MLDEVKTQYLIVSTKLLNDKRLTYFDCILYGMICFLSNKSGKCTASNKTLANLFDKDVRTIIRSIDSLIKYGYLKSKLRYVPGTKSILHRELKPSDKNVSTYSQKSHGGSDKNVQKPSDKNVTHINKKDINNIYKKDQLTITDEEYYQDSYDLTDFM